VVASVGAGAAARRVEFPRRGERAGKIAWNASRTFLVKRRQVLPRPLRARPQHALHAITTRQEDGSRHPSRRSPVRAASSRNALDWSFPSSTRARVRVPFATTRRDADASPALRRSKSFDPLTRTIEPGPRARTARSSRVCEAQRFARVPLKAWQRKADDERVDDWRFRLVVSWFTDPIAISASRAVCWLASQHRRGVAAAHVTTRVLRGYRAASYQPTRLSRCPPSPPPTPPCASRPASRRAITRAPPPRAASRLAPSVAPRTSSAQARATRSWRAGSISPPRSPAAAQISASASSPRTSARTCTWISTDGARSRISIRAPHRRLRRAFRVNSCAPPLALSLLPPASSHLDRSHSRARRHLFLKDAKYHVPLARIVSQRIAADGNRFDEVSITQILKECPVKVGGGKSQVKLFDLMPNMCVQDFLKIAEDYADDL